MTLFGHKRRAPRRPEEIAPPEIESRPPQTVGMMLRNARLRRGEDIEHVAALLRLRPSYVEAIEQGRYDELPGAAYALGFVRAYAEHLGLDGHEVVRRFKAEAAGLERRQDLSLPMPLSERSRPGGGLLLIALIVAGCAYALWWYLASSERTRPERVAAPPEEIAPGAPRVYGVTHGPVRIVIRATADSWIQIRDRDGSQARILKPGEIYRVPDRPGLTMRTGNAGGIDIFVDGKPAPPLGQSGQTRNAVLDPERLLAGTAIIP